MHTHILLVSYEKNIHDLPWDMSGRDVELAHQFTMANHVFYFYLN